MEALLAEAKRELTRNPPRALKLALRAWALITPATSSESVVSCRLTVGWAHYYVSQSGEAAIHFHDALNLALQNRLVHQEIQARWGLGSAYRHLGRYETALDHLGQAWHLASETNDPTGRMQTGVEIGEVYLDLGQAYEALEWIAKAKDEAQNPEHQAPFVEVLLALGQANVALKRYDEALEYLSRCLVLSSEVGNRVAEARALTAIGILYRETGELEISEEYHLECLKICNTIEHPWGQLEAYWNLGELHRLRGLRDVARRHFDKVEGLARSLEAKGTHVHVLLKLAELAEAGGDDAEALRLTRAARDLEEGVRIQERQANIRSVLDQFQALRSRDQATILRKKTDILEAESAQLKKALDSLRVISELGRRITSSLTVAGLFRTLYESLCQVFELPHFGLALYDNSDGTMRYPLRIHDGVSAPALPRRLAGASLAGWALRHRTTLLIRDMKSEAPRYLTVESIEAFSEDFTFQSAVFLPLTAGDRLIGTLTIQHSKPDMYTEVHANFLDTLAGYIVVALTNALSHRKVKKLNRQILHLAHYDALTGLANRRLFSEHLKRTVAQHQRHQRPFALYFIDLDGFKPINDQWGHPAGDEVLSQLGRRLTLALRDSDLVARVGGDEFVVLATEIEGRASLESLAAKIQDAVVAPVPWKENSLRLGVSIGIALFPEDGTDADALLSAADSAMYEVKRGQKGAWKYAHDPNS